MRLDLPLTTLLSVEQVQRKGRKGSDSGRDVKAFLQLQKDEGRGREGQPDGTFKLESATNL